MKNCSRQGNSLVPLSRPLELFEVLDSLAAEVWDSWLPLVNEAAPGYSTRIYKENNKLILKSLLPGVEKNDVEIILIGDQLTIKAGVNSHVNKSKKDSRQGFFQSQYIHSLTLPYPIKKEKIDVKFEKGILELKLPIVETDHPKKITLKSELPFTQIKKPGRKPKTGSN